MNCIIASEARKLALSWLKWRTGRGSITRLAAIDMTAQGYGLTRAAYLAQGLRHQYRQAKRHIAADMQV